MQRDQFLAGPDLSRRTALRLLTASGAVAELSACRGAGPAPAATAATSPTQPPAQTTPAAQTTAPASTAAKTGGTLNVALSDLGNENLDVILASTNNNVIYLMHERLMLYNEQGELIPWLAESWQMSQDGRQWTFNLRKGVKWTNGDDFTSADVKFSFERFVADDAKSAWSPMHRQTVDQIQTPDDLTVKVLAKSPPYVFYEDAVAGTAIQNKSISTRSGSTRSRSSRWAPDPGS